MKMRTFTGTEPFLFHGDPVGIRLSDFWSWSSSDLLNNTLRGVLAEFIVASALGIDTSEAREDWAAYDLVTNTGRKIEVKCSAYLQSWSQKKLSKITFSIRPARSWNSDDNYSAEIKRWSDLYVFCIYGCKDRRESPLQLDRWEFYVLSTASLNKRCGIQKTIALSSLLSLSPVKVTYEQLRETVENLDLNGD